MRILYEVNITIEEAIKVDYLIWLKEHIGEMVALDCFVKATLYDTLEPEIPGKCQFVVQYIAPSEEAIRRYLSQHAPTLRSRIPEAFQGKFSIERRILIKNRMQSI